MPSFSTLPRASLPALKVQFLAAILVFATAQPAAAQGTTPVDPRLYAGLAWRNLGPFRGGRISAVSGAVGQPGVYYVGTPGGGLWKTTSGGQTWFPVFDAIKSVSSIGAVEVAPSDPNIVYVGTGDMISGGTLDQGNGAYKSIDAGATWQPIGLEATRHIQTILVDPRTPDVVLVGALGDHVHASDQRGVFRSTNGGRSWTRTLYVDDETGIAKLARAYDAPDVIFATTARHYAPPGYAAGSYRSWQLATASGTSGDTGRTSSRIYKSLDNGVSWSEVTGGGLPRLDGRMCMAVAIGTRAQRVFLITNSALYRSDDGGTTWRRMAADDERIHNGQGGYSCGVYVNPANPDIVYTINTAGYRSVDGGSTFTGMKGAPGGDDPQQVWIDPTNGQRILMGYDQGATISLDGGATWSSWYNQSTEQLYHLSADNSFPYWVYATQQDAGAIRTRVRGNYGAVTMFDWNSVNGWEWGTIVPSPLDPQTVFASGAGIVRISYPSEQWINVSPALDPATKARSTSSMPLVWAPWNQRLLLAGLNFVTSTTDGGVHWTRLSPELGIPMGMDSVTATNTLGGRGAIESMSASAATPGVIWVGTNNGLIHLTRDGGMHWRDVSIASLPMARRANISSIEASPHAAGTAYAAVEYLRIGDHAPYVYRTRDFGRTWTKIVTGLPTDEPSGSFARVVRADTKRAGLLFAGTESSVYVSFDDGDHWQSLAMNLPNSPVRDLLVRGNDLLAATHGRGLWVLDDISMLRQVTPVIAASPLHLFAPGAAVRMRRNVNADTPLPPEIPHAVNPLDGVIVDYWLGSAPSGPITLKVLDDHGAVVRHFTSVARAPVAEAARPPHPNFWVAEPDALPASAGMHRVHWDLRHDAPPAFTHSFEINANPGLTPASPEGPLVLPGVYTLRLTANGSTSMQQVTVRNDPRSPATAADVRAQHALLVRLAGGMQSAWSGAEQVSALRTVLTGAAGASTQADVRSAIEALRAAIDSAVGPDRGTAGPRRAPTRPTFQSVNGALASQLTAQDNADWAPTAPMHAAWRSACRDLAAVHAEWSKVLRQDVSRTNAVLKRNGISMLAAPTSLPSPSC
jgi:photosystem II stability/assembly factor-like uncharacterized protein